VKKRVPSRRYVFVLAGVLLIPLLAAWAASGNLVVLLPGTTERVSIGPGGVEGNGWTKNPSISADGRYVAFQSLADNFAPSDWNEAYDIFVFDRETQMLEVITQGWYLEDSQEPVLSADGRYVAFDSDAGNLVPGDSNDREDVFVYDRQTGIMELATVSSTGWQGYGSAADISADGRFVAFHSSSGGLTGDWNSVRDIFVRDRQNGTTELVSMDSNGQIGSSSSYRPSISADGRFVAFSSYASNLVPGDTNGEMDIFVHDRQTGVTERVNVSSTGEQANDESINPSISADGRYVSFTSFATNLVANDSTVRYDIFIHDRWLGTTQQVSLSSDGQEANYHSDNSAISADGRYVTFASSATNLAPGLTDFFPRVFVHDRQAGATELVSMGLNGQEPDSPAAHSTSS
jgi:Tol biopolymer transport system component